MPGKATRPDDKRHLNKGGGGGKGGRPVGSVSARGARGIHQIRAYDDEWELIKRFQKLTRENIEKCDFALKLLEADMAK